ncbi:free fatty acid receptor 2-like [Ambystoma mexicanum]|uniref:free fatty acid receptor 2-like n=1 Tax=Ambystoma mexicanum TaxID=8296 RepID=UPI0037E8DA50
MYESLEKLSLVVYIMTMVLGLPANVFVLYVFYKKARSRLTPNLIYMINLCLSDLLFILFLPVKIIATVKKEWTMPAVLCPVYNFFHFSTIYASVCFLTTVSIGRYLGTAFPISYKIYKKPRYSCYICIGLWFFVFGHCSFALVLESNNSMNTSFFLQQTDEGLQCYENFTQEQLTVIVPVRLELSIVLFFLPLLITVFCYVRCILILMQSRMHSCQKRKAVRVAVTTVAVFIVCFAPYNVSHVVGFVKWNTIWWRRMALLPSACNAFLDPLIFYFLSSAVDKGLVHFWKSLQRKYISTKHHFSSIFEAEPPNSKPQPVRAVSLTI